MNIKEVRRAALTAKLEYEAKKLEAKEVFDLEQLKLSQALKEWRIGLLKTQGTNRGNPYSSSAIAKRMKTTRAYLSQLENGIKPWSAEMAERFVRAVKAAKNGGQE